MGDQKRYLKEWDVFISYASEDKNTIARPLAEHLRRHGLRVWFDEFELSIGDSLTKSINYGLANSSYGIVILSPSFLAKKWTQAELAALVAMEETEKRRILPVWHELGVKELRQSLPMLADIVAVQSSAGLPIVVQELLRAINLPFEGEGIIGDWFGVTGRLRLFNVGEKLQGDYDWNGYEWAGHIEGSLESSANSHRSNFQIIKFHWWWDLSAEKGNGFFILMKHPSYNGRLYDLFVNGYGLSAKKAIDFSALMGSWAFDHENINFEQNLNNLLKQRPHPWVFRRRQKDSSINLDLLSLLRATKDQEDEGSDVEEIELARKTGKKKKGD